MRRPGFALPSGQAHPIERRGDMLVRPTACHAAHHCQRIFSCRATVLPGLRFANTQFRVLAAPPVDREDDIAHRIVDINDTALAILEFAVVADFGPVGKSRVLRKVDVRVSSPSG